MAHVVPIGNHRERLFPVECRMAHATGFAYIGTCITSETKYMSCFCDSSPPPVAPLPEASPSPAEASLLPSTLCMTQSEKRALKSLLADIKLMYVVDAPTVSSEKNGSDCHIYNI